MTLQAVSPVPADSDGKSGPSRVVLQPVQLLLSSRRESAGVVVSLVRLHRTAGSTSCIDGPLFRRRDDSPVSDPDRATSSGARPGHLLRRPLGDDAAAFVAGAGPRSMIQSAQIISSGLCSMTITEWPRSTSEFRASIRRSMSNGMQAGGGLVEDEDRVRDVARAVAGRPSSCPGSRPA